MYGTLQTNEEHRGRQYQYSMLSFSAHCWFPLGPNQAPTQSRFWFPTQKLGHWNLCQMQGFPLSQTSPAAGRDLWVYTKYIPYNSSSLYMLQAMAIKSQDRRSQKAVYAYVELQDVSFHGRDFLSSVQTSSQNEGLGAKTLLSTVCLVSHW